MKINYKKLLPLHIFIIIALNSTSNNNLRISVLVTMFVASIILFLLTLAQDKENAKKKIVVLGTYVLITLMITYFFLNRV